MLASSANHDSILVFFYGCKDTNLTQRRIIQNHKQLCIRFKEVFTLCLDKFRQCGKNNIPYCKLNSLRQDRCLLIIITDITTKIRTNTWTLEPKIQTNYTLKKSTILNNRHLGMKSKRKLLRIVIRDSNLRALI